MCMYKKARLLNQLTDTKKKKLRWLWFSKTLAKTPGSKTALNKAEK